MIPGTAKAKGGRIINISLVEGLRGSAGLQAYVASKFGVRNIAKSAAPNIAKSAAPNIAKYGVRVDSVHPGLVVPPTRSIKSADLQLPMARAAQPDQVER